MKFDFFPIDKVFRKTAIEDFFLLPGINSPFFDLGSRFLPCRKSRGGVFYDRRFAVGFFEFFDFLGFFGIFGMSVSEAIGAKTKLFEYFL